MPMTKAEKQQMEALREEIAMRKALVYPEYVCPKPMTEEEIKREIAENRGITISDSYSRGYDRKVFPGFFFVMMQPHVSIRKGWSDGDYHNWSMTGHFSRGAGVMYRTEMDALLAARHKMTMEFAKALMQLDDQINSADCK